MRFAKPLALIAIIFSLSAFGGVDIMQDGSYSKAARSVFIYAAANSDLKVEVIGNPFTVAKSVTDKAVTDAMQGSDFGINANFTTKPGPNAATNYRIVVMFNPPRHLSEGRLCGDISDLKSGKKEGWQTVLMAFCAGDQPESWISANASPFEGPGGDHFNTVIGNMAWRLIPNDDSIHSN